MAAFPDPHTVAEASVVAEEAALAGGRVILSAAPGVRAVTKGRPGDYVTEVDRESERAVLAVLAERTPGVPVLAEEAGGSRGERYWAVDPLDGTTNFVHGFPLVAVSVALVEGGRPVAGAVHAPFLDETYVASRGGGAVLRNERGEERLSVSSRAPAEAVVATGFPFRDKALLPRYLPMFERCLARFEDLRRPGAASLDLAWTAAGVFDGFFELGLSTWDVAAGGLMIEEAGGRVTDWEGGPGYLSGDILAGPSAVHAELARMAASVRSAT